MPDRGAPPGAVIAHRRPESRRDPPIQLGDSSARVRRSHARRLAGAELASSVERPRCARISRAMIDPLRRAIRRRSLPQRGQVGTLMARSSSLELRSGRAARSELLGAWGRRHDPVAHVARAAFWVRVLGSALGWACAPEFEATMGPDLGPESRRWRDHLHDHGVDPNEERGAISASSDTLVGASWEQLAGFGPSIACASSPRPSGSACAAPARPGVDAGRASSSRLRRRMRFTGIRRVAAQRRAPCRRRAWRARARRARGTRR